MEHRRSGGGTKQAGFSAQRQHRMRDLEKSTAPFFQGRLDVQSANNRADGCTWLRDNLPAPGSIVPLIRVPGNAERLRRYVKHLFELAEKISWRAVAEVGRNFLDGKGGRL